MSSLVQNKHPNIPSNFKSISFSQVDTLKTKLNLSQVRYSQLYASYNNLKQQLASNNITIKSLNTKITNLKQSLAKQQLFHVKTVDYLNQQIKVRVKSQKVWIDYLKRENQFLKNKLKSKCSDSMIKQSQIIKIDRNPINMLLWKIEQMAAQRLEEESKFKQLFVPFFAALYKSKTTEQLFEECIKLFKDSYTYETAIVRGQKIQPLINEFEKQMNEIFGDEDFDQEV